jgi:hypothetical protein
MENSELMLDIGVFAMYAAVRSGVDSVFRAFTAEMADDPDAVGAARVCNARGTAEVN